MVRVTSELLQAFHNDFEEGTRARRYNGEWPVGREGCWLPRLASATHAFVAIPRRSQAAQYLLAAFQSGGFEFVALFPAH
jgi:hypothetical protein